MYIQYVLCMYVLSMYYVCMHYVCMNVCMYVCMQMKSMGSECEPNLITADAVGYVVELLRQLRENLG